MVACLLAFGLAGAAMAAGNISGGFTAGTNSTSTTVSGITGTVTVYEPIADTPFGQAALLPAQTLTVNSKAIAYTPGTLALAPYTLTGVGGAPVAASAGALSADNVNAVNQFYGNFLNTTLAGQTSTNRANFRTATGSDITPLFTPAPVVLPTASNGALIGTAFPFLGNVMNGYTVSQLSVTKFIPAVGPLTAQARAYTVRYNVSDITGTTDGEAWFSNASNGATVLAQTATFAPTNTYYLFTVLKDGGNFDLDKTADSVVVDPATVGVGGGGDDDDDGCVYNPMAGLSVEWALLLLPALGALVARIRRK
jgi:hypothetical protein